MALYVIGDLHLSLSGNKSMDIFPGWHNYVDRTRQNWLAKIHPGGYQSCSPEISPGA